MFSFSAFDCIADDEAAGAQAVVDQCLERLRHASSVWSSLLPVKAYCKAIGVCIVKSAHVLLLHLGCTFDLCFVFVGMLIQGLLSSLLESALSIEEFSVEDCDTWHLLLTRTRTDATALLAQAQPDVSAQVLLHEHVTASFRVTELLHVFASNLQQVDDRWSDGKGPLAVHFTAKEVTSLVAAMFEDTPKQRAFLAKLHCFYSK